MIFAATLCKAEISNIQNAENDDLITIFEKYVMWSVQASWKYHSSA